MSIKIWLYYVTKKKLLIVKTIYIYMWTFHHTYTYVLTHDFTTTWNEERKKKAIDIFIYIKDILKIHTCVVHL